MNEASPKRRPKQFKSPVICADCCTEEPRKSANQIRCSCCAEGANNEKNRLNEERKRREAGIVAIGSTVKCAGCGAYYVWINGAQKDCQACAAARRVIYERESSRRHEKANPRKRNKPVDKERQRRYEAKNIKKIRRAQADYRDRNREKINAYSLARSKTEERKKWSREYESNKRATDPKYRLNQAMKAGLRRGLLEGKGGRKWKDLTGFSLAELSRHLERQFGRGMSWDNYGEDGWHVDHIRPLKSYSFETSECEDFKAVWCLTNLRPLWAPDNLSKHAKITLLV